jgi:hypothetical protein
MVRVTHHIFNSSFQVLRRNYDRIAHSYVCRPGTDRIPEGVSKKFLRNRNRDSCEKSARGKENTGILRIPIGITNLGVTKIILLPTLNKCIDDV